MEILAWLLDPLRFPFMVRALVAAVTVGIVCPVLGTFLVLQGMAFFGDALAHAILPGIVLAFLVGWPLALGALLFGLASAVAIGVISEREEIREDTAIGIVFAGSFALGVALLSTVRSYATDLAHILFGNVLGVSDDDLRLIVVLGILVLLLVVLFYKELLVMAFDPILAVVLRLPVRGLRYLLLVMLAITIVASLQTVGLALMIAMLVTPASTASLLARRVPSMMAVAAALGVASNVVGLYISFYLDVASGPTMVLVATAVFLGVFAADPRRRRREVHAAMSPGPLAPGR